MAATAAEPTTRLWTPTAIKAVDSDARTFEGLASTWGLDLGDDVIHKGAFKRTLDHWRKGKRVMPLIDGHDYSSTTAVIGRMLDAKETDDGLWTTWKLISGSQRADEVLIRLREGVVDGLSIGYRPIKWEMEESDEARWGQVRHLKEVELREVSVVLWPMNEEARVDLGTVKHQLQQLNLNEQQKNEIRALLADSAPPTPPPGPAPAAPPKGADDDLGAPDTSLLDRLRLRRLGNHLEA